MSNIRQSTKEEFIPFIEKLKQSYSRDKAESLIHHFIAIRNEDHKTKEKVGYEIENFMRFSGHYGKCDLKVDHEKNMTFECSCASKKKTKSEKPNSSDDENDDDCNDDRLLNKKPKTRNHKKMKDNKENAKKTNNGLVKRENEEACNFRLVFKSKSTSYELIKAINHNHSANSDEKFLTSTKTIKCSLPSISFLIKGIYYFYIKEERVFELQHNPLIETIKEKYREN